MEKTKVIGLLVTAILIAGCGGGGGGTEEGGELTGGGGTGGTTDPTSDPLKQFSLSNISLDPESLLVTNSTGAAGSISTKAVNKQTTTGPGMGGGSDFSMVGYMQEMIQDEISWHANKFEAEFRLFDWGLNEGILPTIEAGVYKYAHITWPAPVETGVMDVFGDRYYRYTIADDGTWQVDVCGDDQQKFIEYDRLVDATTRTISSTATLVEGFVIDVWDVGGSSSAGGADMSTETDELGLSAGTNQVAMVFKTKLVDSRTLKEDAQGEIEFSEVNSGSQTSYFDDNYMQGVAMITLDNSDPTSPLNTVRGYMLSSFDASSSWGGGIAAVNGLGTTDTYEGSGTTTMNGTQPAMDLSWSCSDLTGYTCPNMDPGSWEENMDYCNENFWSTFTGTCEGTDYQTCIGLTPTDAAICTFSESYSESYYMEDDNYGYPEFYKIDAVSNSAISDALAGLTALGAGNLQDISFARTWDCTASAWDAESDQSTATLPDEVKDEFADGYDMQDHKDPGEEQQENVRVDMCTDCNNTVETACFDATCYCEDPANADKQECNFGGDAYCQEHPEMCGGSDQGFDYCTMYPDDPTCGEGGYTTSCDEMCASMPPEYQSLCMTCCEDPTNEACMI